MKHRDLHKAARHNERLTPNAQKIEAITDILGGVVRITATIMDTEDREQVLQALQCAIKAIEENR